MKEEWKQIGEFPDYAVSNTGKIKRLVESRTGGRHEGLIKKTQIGDRGYPRTTLYRGNHHKNKDIHVLVLEAFVGPRPENHEPHHKDGVKINNNISNLEWVTPSENIRQNYEMGLRVSTKLSGQEIGTSKLKDEEVYLIKKLLASKIVNQSMIAKMFKTGQPHISSINRGTSWKHIYCKGFESSEPNRLKEEEVYLIKKLSANGKFGQRLIGKMFRLGQQKISQIKNRERYAGILYP